MLLTAPKKGPGYLLRGWKKYRLKTSTTIDETIYQIRVSGRAATQDNTSPRTYPNRKNGPGTIPAYDCHDRHGRGSPKIGYYKSSVLR